MNRRKVSSSEKERGMALFRDFKAFANTGNVVDAAGEVGRWPTEYFSNQELLSLIEAFDAEEPVIFFGK